MANPFIAGYDLSCLFTEYHYTIKDALNWWLVITRCFFLIFWKIHSTETLAMSLALILAFAEDAEDVDRKMKFSISKE